LFFGTHILYLHLTSGDSHKNIDRERGDVIADNISINQNSLGYEVKGIDLRLSRRARIFALYETAAIRPAIIANRINYFRINELFKMKLQKILFLSQKITGSGKMKWAAWFFFQIFICICLVSCKKGSGNGALNFIGISRDTAAYNSTITVYAANFSTAKDTIKLNGFPCSVVSVQGSNITISIPKGAGSGYFSITDGTTTLKGPFFNFLYTSYVTTIAGLLDSGSVDGTGAAASFSFLDGVVVNAAGNLFTSEYSANSRVRMISPAGVVTTFAGSGQYGFADGTAGVAEFTQLNGIAMDVSGNLYVSDYYNQRIRKITPAGNVSTVAGNGNAALQDGPADSASFNGPTGVAVDLAGNIYVADNGNFALRRIGTNGMVTTLTSNGYVALSGPNQTHSTFGFPWGLCLDGQGNLLLGDKGYIWKITPAGSLTGFAGEGQGFTVAVNFEFQFGRVEGLVADTHGNVYAADVDNAIVVQISPYGVATFAGIRGQYLSATDGPWQTAIFNGPEGLAMDTAGNIYVADDYRMRKIIVQ
jgi:sugar lactone lactonase YvrE